MKELKNENELVSIIVPVYRVETVLPRCIESLVKQTYRNLQIILVDDGSPDNCPNICDEYANKDNRICVIHQSNKGPAAARNAGLDVAKGHYIMCVDSDDLIHLDAINHMKTMLELYSASIVICNYQEFDKLSEIDYYSIPGQKEFSVITPEECLSHMFLVNEKICTPWAKMYKRNVFDNIRYPEDMFFGEDMYIAPKLLAKAEKIVLDKTVLYFYCQDGLSLVRSSYNPRKFGRIIATNEWVNFIKERYPSLLNEVIFRFTVNVLDECSKLMDEDQYKNLLIEMSCMLQNEYPCIKVNSFLSGKDKAKAFLIKNHHYIIYRLMRRMIGGQ